MINKGGHPVPGTEEPGFAADNSQYTNNICILREAVVW
jgi:hypothetical protein